MANTKSEKKNIIKIKRNRNRNIHLLSILKTNMKNAVTSIMENSDQSTEKLRLAIKTIDKSNSKGILKKNNASRQKSKLMKLYNKMITSSAEKTVTTDEAKKTKTTKAKSTTKKTTAKKSSTAKKTTTKKVASKAKS
ncbi:hypothetical protein DID75_04185 [Candidatus Marinamargulisbacteria bacterium SCGC AG-410-N11]|nr:hypothetical protein DID75_04185 [Candidatus Marinamargulisbacteria bacterium SCGC AG-410-N11]